MASSLEHYFPLRCTTNYSFLKSASHPEELVETAVRLGYKGIAITDECSFAGIVKAYAMVRKIFSEDAIKKDEEIHSLFKLIIGSEFTTKENINFAAYAPDRTAYGQLSSFITHARKRAEKGEYICNVKDLRYQIRDCLLILFPTLEIKADNPHLQEFVSLTQNRLWLAYEYQQENLQEARLNHVHELSSLFNLPIIAAPHVKMHIAETRALLDTVTAIRLNTSVHNIGFEAAQNGEAYLQPLARLKTHYPESWLHETQRFSKHFNFVMSEIKYEYPNELVPPNLTATVYLRQLVEAGAIHRWGNDITQEVRDLLEKELKLIAELKYEYFFLTVHSIVQFARSQAILCQGRGSAANSAVCFCLGITEVDPAKTRVLFERFISKERNEPPDIDVDFEHERREEVIQFIYQKYTRERAALAATVITYKKRSAIRDVGKALGFDLTLIQHLSKSMAWWDKVSTVTSHLPAGGQQAPSAHLLKAFTQLTQQIIGFPRHLSQHVGGFVISQGPLNQLVPIENANMPDRTVVQWDKDDIETLGLLKVDVLALGMLSAIRRCFDLVENYKNGKKLTMAEIEQDDPNVYGMLQRADTIGVFQVESRAQMSMLPRLKPKNYYDLVVQVAIVRPGPIQGNMVHPYLKRRQGIEPVGYPSPAIEDVLKRTLGVPIFQEQVIEIAVKAAGFTPGRADLLRRAMASWRKKGDLEKYQQELRVGLLKNGYTEEFAERIIEQINGFGEYGFPESHAASFALLAYVSAWLKYHEPAAFCCALINSQPMGFYSASQLIQDARRHNIEILPIDITQSDWDCSLEQSSAQHSQPAIRLGLRLINSLSKTAAETLVNERKKSPFKNLYDFNTRTQLNSFSLNALAKADAFKSISGHRFQTRWEVLGLEQDSPLVNHETNTEKSIQLSPPTEAHSMIEDYASTNLSLRTHPMKLLRSAHLKPLENCKTHEELKQVRNKGFAITAGLVTCRQRPGTKTGVVFLTLEDETGNTNIVVWSDLVKRYKRAVVNGTFLRIKGTVEKEEDVLHFIAGHIEDLSDLIKEIETHSRDFH